MAPSKRRAAAEQPQNLADKVAEQINLDGFSQEDIQQQMESAEAKAQRVQIRRLRREFLKSLGYTGEITDEMLTSEFWTELYERVITKEVKEEAPPLSNVIAQAQAEVQQQPQGERHPLPDTYMEVGKINHVTSVIASTLLELHETVPGPLTVTELNLVIGSMQALAQVGNKLAWQVGMHAVEQGLISQIKLAELLNTSQATVSRRYREIPEETEKHQA